MNATRWIPTLNVITLYIIPNQAKNWSTVAVALVHSRERELYSLLCSSSCVVKTDVSTRTFNSLGYSQQMIWSIIECATLFPLNDYPPLVRTSLNCSVCILPLYKLSIALSECRRWWNKNTKLRLNAIWVSWQIPFPMAIHCAGAWSIYSCICHTVVNFVARGIQQDWGSKFASYCRLRHPLWNALTPVHNEANHHH